MFSRILHVLKSKTVWTAISVAAFTAFNENVQDWISEHPGHFGKIICFGMLTLRALTFGPLIPKEKKDD